MIISVIVKVKAADCVNLEPGETLSEGDYVTFQLEHPKPHQLADQLTPLATKDVEKCKRFSRIRFWFNFSKIMSETVFFITEFCTHSAV